MLTKAWHTARTSWLAKRLPRWAARWRRCGLNLLFPPRCAYCHADLTDRDDDLMLCGDCRDALGPRDWTWCSRCGAPVLPNDPPSGSCDMCQDVRLWFDTVVSLGAYRSELGTAVLRMKRRDGEWLSAVMGRLYCDRRGDDLKPLRPNVIAPIPMYWSRRLARGTNSPDILAGSLARHLRLPVASGMLVRRRNTLPQASLPPGKRFKNVRGAFRLRERYDLEGARVVLVDDILTTGATCSEIAKLLKQGGASMVAVAVLARGVGDHSS